MAKPNYQFEKRQRDLAKKNKQEEKRRQKLAGNAIEKSAEDEPTVAPDTPDSALSGAGADIPERGANSAD